MFEHFNKKDKLNIPKIRELDLRSDEMKAEVERAQKIAAENVEKCKEISDRFKPYDYYSHLADIGKLDIEEASELGHSPEELYDRAQLVYGYFFAIVHKIKDLNSDLSHGRFGVTKEAMAAAETETPALLQELESIVTLLKEYDENNQRLARKREFVDGLFAVDVKHLDTFADVA